MSLLFFGKARDPLTAQAGDYLETHLGPIDRFECERGAKLPDVPDSSYDYVLSYLCPIVLPQTILERARVAALNFHPGPPEYPGIGCTNFALYDEAERFGVTCHHMAASVDAGPIVAVRRFPLRSTDTVLSLTRRCHAVLFELFFEIADALIEGRELPSTTESWTRPPYRRRELDALCRIEPDMPDDEIRRRVRATRYPGYPGAYVELAGLRFELAG